ncbi:hypothetical protein JCM21900_001289 [Sporobolomyces salmonicolor]
MSFRPASERAQPVANSSKAASRSLARPSPTALADLPFVQLDDPPPHKLCATKSQAASSRSDAKGKGKQAEVLELDNELDEEEQQDGVESEAPYPLATVRGTTREQEKLQQLESELADLDFQIANLQKLRSSIRLERGTLQATIRSRQTAPSPRAPPAVRPSQAAIDYSKGSYSWSQEAKELAREFWGVENWRMCQEGAINATMSGREVAVVMPTGGGKSLIYQVPALLSRGTTVVITPLISLMVDQVTNLTSRGISAEAIHASTTQEQSKSIMKRMLGDVWPKSKGKGKKKAVVDDDEDEKFAEIKLVYVTPERIEKSKTFMSTLQKMYDAGLLARFVIDEAHCISMLGHDYRTSYLSLKRLKVLFPNIPILAVTATAPQNVIGDMLKTLGLPRKTSPGSAALANTTVVFTAPLYRANLHYAVAPKPSNAQAAIDAIIDWILNNHVGDTGIVYCLSRADSENVAKGINASEKCRGKLRAAVYHAYIDDVEKLRVHDLWRSKKIQVVCATNASFGLGIDNPSVRYVVHHSLAKSMANFYQEAGRAGRDGKTSDCITFWRAADASRLSTLVFESWRNGAKQKLYDVVAFAEDYRTCRKVLFARYFASTYDNDTAFDENGDDPCGVCDNCTRDPFTISTLDISLHAYRALRIISAANSQRGTLTLPQAADLVRGNGGGTFSTQEAKSKGKGKVDVTSIAGGKVTLGKDETEAMLLKLLVDDWLLEDFHATAYAVNSYLECSTKALRFTRLAPDHVESSGLPLSLTMDILVSSSGGGKKRKSSGSAATKAAPAKKKAKTAAAAGPAGPAAISSVGKRAVDACDEEGEEEKFAFEDDDRFEEEGAEGDADELEAMLAGAGAEHSSDPPMDKDGWSHVRKARKVEVLELD